MKSVGIVAEYNPFHLGHEYNLQKAREIVGADAAVIAVMSGDFVQRGEAALFNKYARAHAAVMSGADLVIELPLSWSIATAEIFARGAVGILNAIGVTDICFGSETDDLELLCKAADIISSDSFNSELKIRVGMNRSIPFAAQREQLLKEKLGSQTSILSEPNNILGIEYLKAVNQLDSAMKPHCIKRMGNAHDSRGDGCFRSASEIRDIFRSGSSIEDLIPKNAFSVYDIENKEGRIQRPDDERYISRLMYLSTEEFKTIAYCGGGLSEALYKAVRTSLSVNDIIEKVTCKTFARARVRRAVLSAVLKNTMEPGIETPGYARILASGPKGRAWIKEVKDSTSIPFITKSADMRKLPENVRMSAEMTSDAHDFYILGYKDRKNFVPGEDWLFTPSII